MNRNWNAGKDLKVKRWVDADREHRRAQFVAWVLVVIVFFAVFVGVVFGVMWGRMERDCTFIAQSEGWRAVPDYCKVHRLGVM
jgi:hypothetical protein